MGTFSRKDITVTVASLFLAGAVSSLSATRAHASGEYVTMSAFSGYSGITIQVSGGNFQPNEPLTIYAGQQLGSVATVSDAYGQFGPVAYTVPEVASGNLPITVVGGSERADNNFYVQAYFPSITLSDGSATPFGAVSVSGSGFKPGETVNVDLADTSTPIKADAKGGFLNLSIHIPFVPAGTQKVVAIGVGSQASSTAYLYVNGFYASVYASSSYIIPGQTLTFNGAGFVPSEIVDVARNINGQTEKAGTITASTSGDFKKAGALVVPVQESGQHVSYTFSGETSHATSSVDITVGNLNPLISPSNYYLLPASTFSVSASGFLSNEKLDLKLDSKIIATVQADKDGVALFDALTFPVSGGQTATFSVVGEMSSANASAAVTVGQYHPYASVDNSYATAGTKLTVSGGGFAPGETAHLAVGGVADVTTVVADKFGNIAGAIVAMPKASANSNQATIVITGENNDAPVEIGLTIAPFLTQISPSSYYLTPGTSFALTGSDFAPDELVDISLGDQYLGYSIADKKGNFSAVTTLPFGKKNLVYTATGQTSLAPATVAVSLAPFNANLSLGSYYATAGSPLTVSGSGFAANEVITVAYDGSTPVLVTSDTFGAFTTSIDIPFGVPGSKTITAMGALSQAQVSSSFTLASFNPSIGLSAYYAAGGSAQTISGSGYAPHESLTVTWDGSSLPSVEADAFGAFSLNTTVPFSMPGSKMIVVTGQQSSAKASATFTEAAFSGNIILSSYYGNGGTDLMVTGSGYVSGESVDIMYGGAAFASVTVDKKGGFATSGVVPFGKSGDYSVAATGSVSHGLSSATFTLAPTYQVLQLGSYAGAPGSAVTFIGSGYLPGEQIVVTTDRDSGTVYSLTADTTGAFTDAGFLLPASYSQGNLAFTVVGQHSLNSKSVTFYVAGK